MPDRNSTFLHIPKWHCFSPTVFSKENPSARPCLWASCLGFDILAVARSFASEAEDCSRWAWLQRLMITFKDTKIFKHLEMALEWLASKSHHVPDHSWSASAISGADEFNAGCEEMQLPPVELKLETADPRRRRLEMSWTRPLAGQRDFCSLSRSNVFRLQCL